MTYSRIRRGPMAADQFTQIRNAVFRDSRLSAKAMGIFGNISTHRDGWGITPESISTQMRDGVDGIKAGLRELEKYGYLQRERERRSNGTLGASTYYITDEPETVDSSRSEPEGAQPPQAEPPVAEPAQAEPPEAEPTVADPLHKKTNSTRTPSGEDHPPSLPLPGPRAPKKAADEREGGREAAPLNDQEQAAVDALTRTVATEPRLTLGEVEILRLAPLAAAWLTRSTEAAMRDALTAGLPGRVESPAGLVRRRLVDKLPPVPLRAAPVAGLPEWCGTCDGPEAARRFVETEAGGWARCPTCHPAALAGV